jgi:release factor glutamine methyltransferase
MVQMLLPVVPDTAAAEARLILQRRAGLDWATLIANPTLRVEKTLISNIFDDLQRLIAGEPLSRIYGTREFYGLEFALNAHTLDPRLDTELLVDLALERLKGIENPRVLDLGTGSGCILIAILHHIKDAQGVGIDLSHTALQAAKTNAARHGVAPRAQFICGNWAESIGAKFDLVVSNPPYIENQTLESLPNTVKNHDPILALAGGKDGLQAYRQIFLSLPKLLKPGGIALFEIGFDQEDSLTRLSKESRFLMQAVHRDWGGQPRVAEIILPA